jgi:hypothetical protein
VESEWVVVVVVVGGGNCLFHFSPRDYSPVQPESWKGASTHFVLSFSFEPHSSPKNKKFGRSILMPLRSVDSARCRFCEMSIVSKHSQRCGIVSHYHLEPNPHDPHNDHHRFNEMSIL